MITFSPKFSLINSNVRAISSLSASDNALKSPVNLDLFLTSSKNGFEGDLTNSFLLSIAA